MYWTGTYIVFCFGEKWAQSVSVSYKKTNQTHYFLQFIFGIKFYMSRTVPPSIIRSFSLHAQQCYMSYRFADSLRAGSGRNCPKHVELYSKNKLEKLVHLVGFIIRNVSRRTVTWTSNSVSVMTHIRTILKSQ